jgi:hypothetical protein
MVYILEYFSATKRNEILSFAAKWMELEDIMLSEINPAQKEKLPHILFHIQKLKTLKLKVQQ